MAENTERQHSLDDYFQQSSLGSLERAIGDNLFGLNLTQAPGVVPSNRITYGYTFFTRPQLNMQQDNLRNDRKLYPLLSTIAESASRAIRCTLDPRIITGYNFGKSSIPPLDCPIIDNKNAFIPLLSNNITTISGWPDIVTPTFTSKPGLFNEVYSQVDGIVDNYEAYDITANFRNTYGAPIMALFYYWQRYSTKVFNGQLIPYLDYIINNRIDYNTRIYRLVMDKEKRRVEHICATGAAYPTSAPTGGLFDFNADGVYNDQIKDIPITFKCMGFETFDDILASEFNTTVMMFNPDMKDGNRDRFYIKIPAKLRPLFNHRCYPYINTYTSELEWWVPKAIYNARTNSFLAMNVGDLDKQDAENFGD